MTDAAIDLRLHASTPRAASQGSQWGYGLLLSMVSVAIFLLNTRHGIGVEPDTTRYMRLGPESYDDPLYVWVLDLIRMAGVPFEAGAKAFALAMVAANSLAIWSLLLRGTGSVAHAAVGTLLILLSPQFIGAHAVAMSEAPFFLCLFLVVFAGLRFLESERIAWLACCGVALGLAMLARFAALPMALAMAVVLLANPRRRPVSRIGEVAFLALISGALFFGWLVESKLTGGNGTGRDLAFHGTVDAGTWNDFVDTLSTFLMPSGVTRIIGAMLLLIVVGGTAYLYVAQGRSLLSHARHPRSSDEVIPLIWGLFAAFYLPFMALAIAIEANLRPDGRYLLPFYVAMVLTAVPLVARRTRPGLEHLIGAIFTGLGALLLVSHAARATFLTRTNFREGITYSSIAWRDSPTIEAVRQLPCDAAIFSKSPDALNYLTRRKTDFTPFLYSRRTGLEDPARRPGDVLERIRQALATGNGYLVFFDRGKDRFYAMSEAEIVARLHPPLTRREADGRIYGPYSGASHVRAALPATNSCGDD